MAAPITGPQRVPTPPNKVTISACDETITPNTTISGPMNPPA